MISFTPPVKQPSPNRAIYTDINRQFLLENFILLLLSEMPRPNRRNYRINRGLRLFVPQISVGEIQSPFPVVRRKSVAFSAPHVSERRFNGDIVVRFRPQR